MILYYRVAAGGRARNQAGSRCSPIHTPLYEWAGQRQACRPSLLITGKSRTSASEAMALIHPDC